MSDDSKSDQPEITPANAPDGQPIPNNIRDLFDLRKHPLLRITDIDVYHAWLQLGLSAGWVRDIIGSEFMWDREKSRPQYQLAFDTEGMAAIVRHLVDDAIHDKVVHLLAHDLGMETRAHPLLKMLYGETSLSMPWGMREKLFPDEMVEAMSREFPAELLERMEDRTSIFRKLREILPADSPLRRMIDAEVARIEEIHSRSDFRSIFQALKEPGSPYRIDEIGEGTDPGPIERLDPPARQDPLFSQRPQAEAGDQQRAAKPARRRKRGK